MQKKWCEALSSFFFFRGGPPGRRSRVRQNLGFCRSKFRHFLSFSDHFTNFSKSCLNENSIRLSTFSLYAYICGLKGKMSEPNRLKLVFSAMVWDRTPERHIWNPRWLSKAVRLRPEAVLADSLAKEVVRSTLLLPFPLWWPSGLKIQGSSKSRPARTDWDCGT